MPIPEAQLEVWSHQGSITQSKNTYATVKAALENIQAKYSNRNFQVFLQGSYCNDTNIFAESDVDVVIRHDSVFFHDLNELPPEQKNAFQAHFQRERINTWTSRATSKKTWKRHSRRQKSIRVQKRSRLPQTVDERNADVVVAFQFRRYFKFNSVFDENHIEGIGFELADGTLVSNYPKLHSANCTAKHQATGSNFKPLVRIFKNMRSRLVDEGVIEDGVAPSYYIEGLLYNVPNDQFVGSYEDMVQNILVWLHETVDKTKFVCANEQYYLLRDNEHVCWPIGNGQKLIDSVIKLWNEWN